MVSSESLSPGLSEYILFHIEKNTFLGQKGKTLQFFLQYLSNYYFFFYFPVPIQIRTPQIRNILNLFRIPVTAYFFIQERTILQEKLEIIDFGGLVDRLC